MGVGASSRIFQTSSTGSVLWKEALTRVGRAVERWWGVCVVIRITAPTPAVGSLSDQVLLIFPDGHLPPVPFTSPGDLVRKQSLSL